MPIVDLTDDFIVNHLSCPIDKRKIEFADRKLPGFLVEVTKANPGVGSYRLRYRDASNCTRYKTFGRTDAVKLEDARNAAKVLKVKISIGEMPESEEDHGDTVPTLNSFVANEYTRFTKTRKRTWGKDLERYRNHIQPAMGDKQLTEIKKPHIQALHAAVRERGLSGATADHVLKVIRQILNLAVDYEYLEKNPAKGVKQFNIDNRMERYLDEDELQRLLRVLKVDSSRTVCHIVMFLISTGARLQEACQARVSDVSMKDRVWHIPASRSKSKKVRKVPLNDTAVAVIDGLDLDDDQEYLFPNPRTELPYTTIHKSWCRIRKAAGLDDLRLHDLRHTFISYLLQNGRTLYEAQVIAGHSSSVVTERYAHLSMRSLQEAANTASGVIEEAKMKLA